MNQLSPDTEQNFSQHNAVLSCAFALLFLSEFSYHYFKHISAELIGASTICITVRGCANDE